MQALQSSHSRVQPQKKLIPLRCLVCSIARRRYFFSVYWYSLRRSQYFCTVQCTSSEEADNSAVQQYTASEEADTSALSIVYRLKMKSLLCLLVHPQKKQIPLRCLVYILRRSRYFCAVQQCTASEEADTSALSSRVQPQKKPIPLRYLLYSLRKS